MEKIKHCKHCLNKSFESNRGIVCGLTNEKPKFLNKCQEFSLSQDSKKEWDNVQFQLNERDNKNWSINLTLYMSLGLGAILIGMAIILRKIELSKGVISTGPPWIMGFGVICMSIGLRQFSMEAVRKAKLDKTSGEIMSVMTHYGQK